MEFKAILENCRGLKILKDNPSNDYLERDILELQVNKIRGLLKNYLYFELCALTQKDKDIKDWDSLLTLFEEFPEMAQSVYGPFWKMLLKECSKELEKRSGYAAKIIRFLEKNKRLMMVPGTDKRKQYRFYLEELAG